MRVTIPSGAGLRAISDSLERTGVVRSAKLFRIYASLRGGDREIKAGTYVLHRGTGWGTVLSELRAGKRPPVAEIVRRAEVLEARGFVIGLPLDGNGDETPRCAEARTVGAVLSKRTGLPVEFIDERYSTATALRAIREMGGSRKDRKADVDSLAATVILQQALARAS